MKTINVALLGAGRMGSEHALNMRSFPGVQTLVVAAPHTPSAEKVADLVGAKHVLSSPEEAIERQDVDAVVIVTPTSTHARLIEHAARSGKAIFCEKPVALDLTETARVLRVVEEKGVLFQIGFQRRFDVGFMAAREAIQQGTLGDLEQFRAVGRDPAPPPIEYLKVSGGIFLDQAIHDFDAARFLVGEVEEVLAWGAVRVNPEIGALGDADTVTTLLKFKNGTLGVIENSRRAVYGYDIRTEVFGSQGKYVIEALPKTPVQHYGTHGIHMDHYHFFMDRFAPAYRAELAAFFRVMQGSSETLPGTFDALESLKVGIAATRSYRENRPVKIMEIQEGVPA
ncbi:inositol 2-dehydrogenase [Deinococcus cellulosilyticus]|uniref:Inositol 2-dehydrogenase n=1 Tax=Deinococcus cellulosilyticus (strain DSM 18568 / NBRC 106333 / KACC 11606 / 5516J-15) TaxID=1223518 RepID=A0A511N061_DEIC1|nr:inositol 2-dehydrogenase [Deinococcus cellulosilyticus]GEM46265.1 inositol 2-dehydrogenase [Deinococcus cellulosilyticus NBRC 106333 = KACC 11606]